MEGLVDRHHRMSKKLIARLANSANRFGVSHGQYAGLLVKQVAVVMSRQSFRVSPTYAWKLYLSHSTESFHILLEQKYWDMVDDYGREYLLHSPEVVRQFLLLSLEYLARHPKAVPEDIPQALIPRMVA